MATLTTAGDIATDILDNHILADGPSGDSLNEVWLWWAGILVLIMHLGFAFLEAGSVQKKNALNVMFKNIMTITLGGVSYYFLGYAIFSAGTDGAVFAGGDNWLMLNEPSLSTTTTPYPYYGSQYFFQFAFAATAATIVSGAVAGRITLPAYACVVVLLTGFQYPAVAHWVWATTGWLTNFYPSSCDADPTSAANCPIIASGFRDFAGSGVVHMSGAFSALAGIIVLGPRDAAVVDGKIKPPKPSSTSLMAIGVFVLWIGWYGFNCGSTLTIAGYASGMGHAAICTTLAPSTAVITAMVYSKIFKGYYDLPIMLNAALAGLVSITASANIMDFGFCILVGFVGFFAYYGGATLLKRLGLDDPVEAIAVHGFAGIWGCFAVPIASSVENGPEQFGMQVVAVLVIIAWNFTLTFLLFFAMARFSFKVENKEKFLRATSAQQEAGLDASEHDGGEIYKSF